MDDVGSQSDLRCSQCASSLVIPEGELFLTCSHCGSTLYLDRSQVVLHYVMARTLQAETALRALRRWMAGGETAKDLDRTAEIEEPVLRYFPLWRYRVSKGEEDRVYVKPAAVTTLGLLDGITIPPGELRPHDPKLAPYLVPPTVSHRRAAGGQEARETALVHVPLFFFQYRFQGRAYQAAVDASTGRVFAETYPRRRDLPYLIVAAVAFVAFTAIAFVAYLLVPPGSGDLGIAYLARASVQLLAAMLLFLVARHVARTV